MEIVIHRVNTLENLRRIPEEFGAEIDIRAYGSKLILNHEPFQSGLKLEEFLREYQHGLLVLNIKEAGIESKVLELVSRYKIKSFFLLDVEFPYIYRASREGCSQIAMRYSEDEPIESAQKFAGILEWVWIDTNTQLPLSMPICHSLTNFKTCLVCPERWGRPKDIPVYRRKMLELAFEPTAVMTSLDSASQWQ